MGEPNTKEAKSADGYVYIRVRAEDVPPGTKQHVMVPLVDVQRLTAKVVMAKNKVTDLHPRLVDLCTSNELCKQGVADVAEQVKKKLNIDPPKKKGPAAAKGSTRGAKGDGGGAAEVPNKTITTNTRPRKRVRSLSSDEEPEDDSGSDASEMKRDAKRPKAAERAQLQKDGVNLSSAEDNDDDDGDDEEASSVNGDAEEEGKGGAAEQNDQEGIDDLEVDYDAAPELAKNNRIVRPVVHRTEGQVGVYVAWDIPPQQSIKMNESIQNAEVDKQLRTYGMPSMESLWKKNAVDFAEFFEEVVNGTVTGLLREIVKAKGGAVFVQKDVLLSSGELTDDQYIYNQPQPLRSALLYARKTFFDFRHDDEDRLNMLVQAVKFVKPYLDSLRKGYPPLNVAEEQDDED